MATKTQQTYRKHDIGATVYVVDELGNVIAGTVADTLVESNGYPRTWVSFPTPLRFGGVREWAVERLVTFEEARALVAERKSVQGMFFRKAV